MKPSRFGQGSVASSPKIAKSKSRDEPIGLGGLGRPSTRIRERLRGGSADTDVELYGEEADQEYEGYGEDGEYYEYYDDEGDYVDDGEDGYYYTTDEVEGGGDDDETQFAIGDDGYVYYPEVTDSGGFDSNYSKRRKVSRAVGSLPRKARGTLSGAALKVRGTMSGAAALPAALPAILTSISTQLASIPPTIVHTAKEIPPLLSNLPNSLNGVSALPVAVVSAVVVSAAMAQIMLPKYLKKRKGRRSALSHDDSSGENLTQNNDEDEDVVDLDASESPVAEKGRRRGWNKLRMQPVTLRIPPMPSLKLIPNSAASMVQNLWVWLVAHSGVRQVAALGRRIAADDDDDNDEADVRPLEEARTLSSPTSDQESNMRVEKLQRQVDELIENNSSLEQEYEASLRMLHDARMELRQLQSSQQDATPGASSEDVEELKRSHQEQLETVTRNLEAKYKSQMKEHAERVRTQLAEKIRPSVEAELREQIEPVVHEEVREILEADMEKRLEDERERQQEELDANFQSAVDEAVSQELDGLVDEAVADALEEERTRSREEMLRVREGIKLALERERRAMKEQVRKVTGQVREWVVKQQQDQLLQQAAQLQEEAERFGSRRSSSNRPRQSPRSRSDEY